MKKQSALLLTTAIYVVAPSFSMDHNRQETIKKKYNTVDQGAINAKQLLDINKLYETGSCTDNCDFRFYNDFNQTIRDVQRLHPDKKIDISSSDCTGSKLTSTNLTKVIMRKVNLTDTDMEGSDARGTDCAFSNLKGTNLYNVKIDESTSFYGAKNAWLAKWEKTPYASILNYKIILYGLWTQSNGLWSLSNKK